MGKDRKARKQMKRVRKGRKGKLKDRVEGGEVKGYGGMGDCPWPTWGPHLRKKYT